MAKTNYKYEKRQKQLDKKKKQEEKLKRRQEQKKDRAQVTPEQPAEKSAARAALVDLGTSAAPATGLPRFQRVMDA